MDGDLDPEQEAVPADSVGLALLAVLDRLRPAERLAFVLHDVFELPFDEIAGIVGRSPAATRQLASRARRRVHGAGVASPDPDPARQRQVVDASYAASRAGDFDALVRILDPDVVLTSEFGVGGQRVDDQPFAVLVSPSPATGSSPPRPARPRAGPPVRRRRRNLPAPCHIVGARGLIGATQFPERHGGHRGTTNPRRQHPPARDPAAGRHAGQGHRQRLGAPTTTSLVRLRAGHIVGSTYQVIRHSADLRAAGESEARIAAVATWWDAPHFTDAERAALALTDAVFHPAPRGGQRVPDDLYTETTEHYDDKAMATLMLVLASAGFWMNIALVNDPTPTPA